jgi:hypothetical protein
MPELPVPSPSSEKSEEHEDGYFFFKGIQKKFMTLSKMDQLDVEDKINDLVNQKLREQLARRES